MDQQYLELLEQLIAIVESAEVMLDADPVTAIPELRKARDLIDVRLQNLGDTPT